MQKITPCLWFDDQAEAAANFYVSTFNNSKVTDIARYTSETPSNKPIGSVLTAAFELEGYQFTSLNGGPEFTINPSISFIVNCSSPEEVDALWEKLQDGGKVLMPLDKYFFSERYGWIQDKFGVSWQLIATNPEGDWRPKITPSLMFVGKNAGRAEEAMQHYTTIFDETQIGQVQRYPAGSEPDQKGTVIYGDFTLAGQWFAAMDSAQDHDFMFSEALSLQVTCETQEEIDRYWNELSAVPESEVCGWLKDKYGVSWQIIPSILSKYLADPDTEKANRVMQAMLKMKKIDIAELDKAYAS